MSYIYPKISGGTLSIGEGQCYMGWSSELYFSIVKTYMFPDLFVQKTYGPPFASDGRLQGDLDVQTIDCDQSANTCAVQVPAPGFALVFLTSAAFSESNPSSTKTFSTTSLTKAQDTATIAAAVLATSNGHSGSTWRLGSTSKENRSGASQVTIPAMMALIAMICGVMAVR